MSDILTPLVLRKVQLIQLEILLEFDQMCKKHNLKYQLFAGTLLGAIRHKGFIPWDDDIDVAMTRSEYNRFLALYSKNKSEDYFLQNYKTDPNFFRQFSRLRKNNTLYLQDGYKKIDMHHGIFIDIFPLDNVKPKLNSEKYRYFILNIMYQINVLKNREVSRSTNLIKRLIGRAVKQSNYLVSEYKFNKYITSLLIKHNDKETGHLNHLTNGTKQNRFNKYLMQYNDFDEVIEGEFENHNFPIPKNYHKILTNLFGNYMELPPKEQQKPHHGIIEVKF